MRKVVIYTVVTLLFCTVFWLEVDAQCAMCKAVIESNQKGGGGVGAGLNDGILYLMAMPYAMVFIGLYFWRKNRKLEASNNE